MLGYKEFSASIGKDTQNKIILKVEGIGVISIQNYLNNAFRPTDISSAELEKLIEGGYESPSIRLKVRANDS